MPYRLVIKTGNIETRHVLAGSDNVVGTAADCAIRLADPTVSRHHALLRVASGQVEVVDLGSRNGTTVKARRLSGPTIIAPGVIIGFGCVAAYVEEVAENDLQPAVSLGAEARDRSPVTPDFQVGATDSMGSLAAFSLSHLPSLASRLAEGAGLVAMAQAVGASLFDSLPCLAVAVAGTDGRARGILFHASRSEREDVGAVTEAEARGLMVRVVFANTAAGKSFAPLVRAAACLVASARDGAPHEPAHEPSPGPPPPPDPPTMVAEVRAIYQDAARVAPSNISVLITGESGTGKEVLARFIHAASRCASGPLVALNCAALPRDLLESELFGIERGVATGVDSRPGKLELAHGGTLFLDEIGDMPPEVQAHLLRVLQEGQVYRVGGRDPRPARARVISATNRDIDALLADGTFRNDLYHRISDWRVDLPPLRRRRADIPNLAAYFLARESARRDGQPVGISRAALDALVAYSWPGNLRQLEREMARAALFVDDGQLLETRHLQPAVVKNQQSAPQALQDILSEVERREIAAALERAAGDTTAAAQALGLARSTLYRRMKDLGIPTPGHA